MPGNGYYAIDFAFGLIKNSFKGFVKRVSILYLRVSNAETTFIENLTPLQHKVIRAFKAVIKYHHSNWSPNIKDIICTYHLKTIAFWHVEKTTQDSWTEDNAVSHLLSLMEEFAEASVKESKSSNVLLAKVQSIGKRRKY